MTARITMPVVEKRNEKMPPSSELLLTAAVAELSLVAGAGCCGAGGAGVALTCEATDGATTGVTG